jgi:SNF2 family DNA or RNA helicase
VHADLAEDGDSIVLDPTWQETELLKLVPGARFATKENPSRWHVPLTWASMINLRGMFGDHFTYSDALRQWTWEERTNRIDPSLELREVIEWPAGSDPSGLHSFQRVGVEWMNVADSGLLGDEMGVGKTPQALVYTHENKLLPALVICPNAVKYHWAKRVPRWCPSATVYIVDGGAAKGRKILAEAMKDPTALVIVNYESVRMYSRLSPYGSIRLKRCKECDPRFGDDIKTTQCHVHQKELNKFNFASVIIDEAHRVGNPQTLQTRAVWAVAHGTSVKKRWALTGTPDDVKRLWSIMHTVSPDEYPTRGKWMDRYALQAWNAFGGMDIIGIRPDTREELYRVLDPRFRRMLKEVVLPQLPPITRQVRHTTLTPPQRRAYDELDKQLFTQLPNGELFVAQNKLVSRTRLMQFAAGSVHVDKPDADDVSSWNVRIEDPSAKVDELDSIIDELGRKPFVVACEHRDIVSMAAERLGRLGISHQLIVGGVHPETAEQACEDLKTGRLRAIVFTSRAGGVGLDMSGVDTLIRLQRSWSLIANIQVEGRAHRIGSEGHSSVNIIDVVTRDTIEQHQIEKLLVKMEQLEEITRDRKQVQSQLARTPFTSAEFSELVGRLDSLNHRRDRILATDDIEAMMTEEQE